MKTGNLILSLVLALVLHGPTTAQSPAFPVTVMAWGDNYDGQSNVPRGLSNVVTIAAGDLHSLALVGPNPPFEIEAPLGLPDPGDRFRVSLLTRRGKAYRVDSKNALDDPTWTLGLPLPGDDTVKAFIDPKTLSPQRFYRVRAQ